MIGAGRWTASAIGARHSAAMLGYSLKPHHWASAAACLTISIGIGLVASLVRPSLDAALLGAIALILIAPLCLRYAQKRFDVFEPLTFFALTMFFIVVLRVAALMVTNNFAWRGVDTRSGLTPMLMVAFAGILAWVVGYEAAGRRRSAVTITNAGAPLQRPVVAAAAVVLASLALGTTVLFLLLGGQPLTWLFDGRQTYDTLFRNSIGYLYDSSLLLIPATLLGVVSWRQGERWPLIVVSCLITPLIVSDVVKGNRLDLADWGVGLATLYFLSRNRRPRWILVFLMVPLLLLGATVLREARNVDAGVMASTALDRAIIDPGGSWNQLVLGPDTEAGQGLMFLVDFVPDIVPFQPGVVVTSVAAQPIPRLLWPGKPAVPEEQIMAQAFPVEYLRNRAGATFTAMGSFYYDSGWLGVIVGMFIVGVGFRRAWQASYGAGTIGGAAVASTIPGITIAFARASVDPAILLMVWTTVPIAVTVWLASRQRSGPHNEASP